MSRTRLAPTPTNISTKSEPDIEKKGRPASPATALARSAWAKGLASTGTVPEKACRASSIASGLPP